MHRTLFAGLLTFGILACADAGADAAADKGTAARRRPSRFPPRTARMLAAGTTLSATIQDTVSSTTSAAAQRVKRYRQPQRPRRRRTCGDSRRRVDRAAHYRFARGDAAHRWRHHARRRVHDGRATRRTNPCASVEAVAHTLSAGAAPDAPREVVAPPGTPITIHLKQSLKLTAN